MCPATPLAAVVPRAQQYAVAVVGAERARGEVVAELLRSAGYLVVVDDSAGPAPAACTPPPEVDGIVLTAPTQPRPRPGTDGLPELVLGAGALTAAGRQELVLQVAVMCRRGREHRLGRQSLGRCLRLDPDTRALLGPGGRIDLTCAEHRLLRALLAAGGAVVRREQLVRETWGPSRAPSSNSLDSCVRRVRAKLTELGVPVELVTVRGHGYRLRAS